MDEHFCVQNPMKSVYSMCVHIVVVTGDDLWRGVTSVSNAGSKRGRGKGTGKKRAIDLNRGQILGEGWYFYTYSYIQKEINTSQFSSSDCNHEFFLSFIS
jgi:hypothetical protein